MQRIVRQGWDPRAPHTSMYLLIRHRVRNDEICPADFSEGVRTSCTNTSSQNWFNILSRATYQWAPTYGGMRTWMEGSPARWQKAPTYWSGRGWGLPQIQLFVTSVCKLLYRLYFYEKNTLNHTLPIHESMVDRNNIYDCTSELVPRRTLFGFYWNCSKGLGTAL